MTCENELVHYEEEAKEEDSQSSSSEVFAFPKETTSQTRQKPFILICDIRSIFQWPVPKTTPLSPQHPPTQRRCALSLFTYLFLPPHAWLPVLFSRSAMNVYVSCFRLELIFEEFMPIPASQPASHACAAPASSIFHF